MHAVFFIAHLHGLGLVADRPASPARKNVGSNAAGNDADARAARVRRQLAVSSLNSSAPRSGRRNRQSDAVLDLGEALVGGVGEVLGLPAHRRGGREQRHPARQRRLLLQPLAQIAGPRVVRPVRRGRRTRLPRSPSAGRRQNREPIDARPAGPAFDARFSIEPTDRHRSCSSGRGWPRAIAAASTAPFRPPALAPAITSTFSRTPSRLEQVLPPLEHRIAASRAR